MDQETAKYIFTFYISFLTEKEKLAWRHYSSTLKLEGISDSKLKSFYFKNGWISSDNEVIKLLENGFDHFEKETAKRILKNNPDEIFLNNCPKCNRLARTPNAKQCRYCKFDWHH